MSTIKNIENELQSETLHNFSHFCLSGYQSGISLPALRATTSYLTPAPATASAPAAAPATAAVKCSPLQNLMNLCLKGYRLGIGFIFRHLKKYEHVFIYK